MLKLTRRRFGQLVIATTTVAGLGYLGKRTIAQTSSIIYGLQYKCEHWSHDSDTTVGCCKDYD